MLGRREGLIALLASVLLIAAAFEVGAPPPFSRSRSAPLFLVFPSSSSLPMPSPAAGPASGLQRIAMLRWSGSSLASGPAA